MFIQNATKIETELVDGKEVQKEVETDRVSIYQEVEKENLAGDKVVVKELVRETTYDEIRADVANLRNSAMDFTNQADALEALLP
jgi:hypothetical protein